MRETSISRRSGSESTNCTDTLIGAGYFAEYTQDGKDPDREAEAVATQRDGINQDADTSKNCSELGRLLSKLKWELVSTVFKL